MVNHINKNSGYAVKEAVGISDTFNGGIEDNMESIWTKATKIKEQESLHGDLAVDAAVIGGGMAGILTGWFLQENGIHTAVLEALSVGSGQTKNTTAKITSQHGLIYEKMIRNVGMEKACQYAKANQAAISAYRKIIHEQKIDCQMEECPAYLYSRKDRSILEREAEAAKSIGLNVELTMDVDLPFEIKGALRQKQQAQFQPLEFLKALAEKMEIYENTCVSMAEGNKIHTNHGTVTAKYIIFASHYPFINVPGYYFARMYQERSYVLALKGAAKLDGIYYGIDEDGLSFRNSGDLLLLGGGKHRTGDNKTGGRYERLRQTASELWPESEETAHWSAQDCITLDGIPYIGRYSKNTPDWYVATGFGKWGMTGSMTAAMLLCNAIKGETNPYAEVFQPQRFLAPVCGKELIKNSSHAVYGISKQMFSKADIDVGALPCSKGGIVDCGGEKLGVYKDMDGEVYIVSAKCPHMGCQLEWNPDERSWDCPCHGSRFDYRGQLLDNPAQEGLAHE